MVNVIERRLRQRFREFFTCRPEVSAKSMAIRNATRSVLNRAMERRWRTYVVGGTLRDLLLAPAWACPRDIDLVVSGREGFELELVFGDLLIRKTRFGGLHLAKSIIMDDVVKMRHDILIDVWRLEDTWAIQRNGLEPRIENFVRTPFLNIDSIAIELSSDILKPRIFENRFFESIASRTLDIVFEPNPFPLLCVMHSLITAAKLRFWISARLAQFVCEYTRWGSLEDLMEAQLSHYGSIRCSENELAEWLARIHCELRAGARAIDLGTHPDRQLELWRDWPVSVAAKPQVENTPSDAMEALA